MSEGFHNAALEQSAHPQNGGPGSLSMLAVQAPTTERQPRHSGHHQESLPNTGANWSGSPAGVYNNSWAIGGWRNQVWLSPGQPWVPNFLDGLLTWELNNLFGAASLPIGGMPWNYQNPGYYDGSNGYPPNYAMAPLTAPDAGYAPPPPVPYGDQWNSQSPLNWAINNILSNVLGVGTDNGYPYGYPWSSDNGYWNPVWNEYQPPVVVPYYVGNQNGNGAWRGNRNVTGNNTVSPTFRTAPTSVSSPSITNGNRGLQTQGTAPAQYQQSTRTQYQSPAARTQPNQQTLENQQLQAAQARQQALAAQKAREQALAAQQAREQALAAQQAREQALAAQAKAKAQAAAHPAEPAHPQPPPPPHPAPQHTA